MENSPPSRRRFWLSTVLGPVLAGLLYRCAFAPVEWPPMVVLGLVAFLYCLRGLSPVEARRAGFLFGMTVTCASCFWLKHIFGWVFIVLCAAQSLFWGLFGWVHAILDRQPWSRWRKALPIACVWTGVEYIRAEHFWLDFPWLTTGHGLGVIQFITQPVLSCIGVYGVGFVVVMFCVVITPSHIQLEKWMPHLIQAVIGLFVCMDILAILLGLAVPAFHAVSRKASEVRSQHMPKVSFAAIQDEQCSLENFMAISRTSLIWSSGRRKPYPTTWPGCLTTANFSSTL